MPLWLARGARSSGGRAGALADHRGHPALRTRAAEFERTSGDAVADALPTEPGGALRRGDAIVVNAYMSAYTAGLLAWADCNGERKLEELIDEAFDALQGAERAAPRSAPGSRSSTTVTSGRAPIRIGGPQ